MRMYVWRAPRSLDKTKCLLNTYFFTRKFDRSSGRNGASCVRRVRFQVVHWKFIRLVL